MKNKVIAGGVILAGIAGAMLLGGNSPSEQDAMRFQGGARDNDYTTERSYEEYGDRDCGDFSSQVEAQSFFEAEGGPYSDYHGLDRDEDGIACESI